MLFGERALGTLPENLNKEVELEGRGEHAEEQKASEVQQSNV